MNTIKVIFLPSISSDVVVKKKYEFAAVTLFKNVRGYVSLSRYHFFQQAQTAILKTLKYFKTTYNTVVREFHGEINIFIKPSQRNYNCKIIQLGI